jgi:hypothetical protein
MGRFLWQEIETLPLSRPAFKCAVLLACYARAMRGDPSGMK